VVTAVTYTLVFEALRQRDLKHLETYVEERGLREEARFQQVQSNLELARGQFLKRLESAKPKDLEARWNERFLFYPDGAWRSRKEFADGRKYAQMWAHKNWKLTPEAQTETIVAGDLCEELLPGWVDSFPSVYFNFPGPLNIGYDARIPSWVWDMPADYDTEKMEWLKLALPKVPPLPDVFLWTGVQQDVDLTTENPLVNAPMVSIFLPIYRDGAFLGSVGHDMFMTGMLDEAMRSDIPGAMHLIFRADSRLVAHPELRQRILMSKGMLTAPECGDATVASLYQVCVGRSERRFSDFDPKSDSYYSAARLAGPEWFFVTVMPRSYLQEQASASAQWVLWSGLISLALVLGFTALILRGQIARPLAELTRATKSMTPGESLPVSRGDELGALAGSFSEMAGQVAERQRVQVELERALERERDLVRLKTNFVSLVSHEFRTPLGVILSSSEILGKYFDALEPAERTEQLEAIKANVLRMSGLMEEVLLFSRLEAGGVAFTPEPLDLQGLCERLRDEVFSATRGRCPILLEAEGDLADARGDEALLRHIISNLLSNGVKYSEEGSAVLVLLQRAGNDAVLTVSDRGIGIPSDGLAKLFEAFHRAKNAAAFAGTGLGLVVVKRCVDLHGGTISIQSTEGGGTTVRVKLPLFAASPS
jgi:signal transduction histidine kinase